MAREYTAWLIQWDTKHGSDFLAASNSVPDGWHGTMRLSEAIQFVRRIDARKAITSLRLTNARPVEKRFG